jgi:hypothetical protein
VNTGEGIHTKGTSCVLLTEQWNFSPNINSIILFEVFQDPKSNDRNDALEGIVFDIIKTWGNISKSSSIEKLTLE